MAAEPGDPELEVTDTPVAKPCNAVETLATAWRAIFSDSEEPVIIDPRPLPLGARVRINGGKLHGLEGNVLEVEDGNLNFVIRVDLLGCAKVNITRDLLELL